MSTNLLSALGVVIAVAALMATAWQGYLLRRQLAHSDRVSRAQFYQQVTAMCIQRDQIFIEHPELWDYFYGSRKKPRNRKERAKVYTASRIMANLADGLASETVAEDFDFHWNNYFRHMYNHSPSFQDFWKEYGHFWPERTRRRFKATDDHSAERAVAGQSQGALRHHM